MPPKTLKEQLAEKWPSQGKESGKVIDHAGRRPTASAVAKPIQNAQLPASTYQEPLPNSSSCDDAIQRFVSALTGERGSRVLSELADELVDLKVFPQLREKDKVKLLPIVGWWKRKVLFNGAVDFAPLRRMIVFCRHDYVQSEIGVVLASCNALLPERSVARLIVATSVDFYAKADTSRQFLRFQHHLSERKRPEREAKLACEKADRDAKLVRRRAERETEMAAERAGFEAKLVREKNEREARRAREKLERDAEIVRKRLPMVPVDEITSRIQSCVPDVKFPGRALSGKDESLCYAWGNVQEKPIHQGLLHKLGGSGYQGMRLYSARQAEIVAAEYYRNFHQSVRDVSIWQVTKEGNEWKSHDLEIDGIPVDVKNSRRSYSSPSSYSEHCIANLKPLSRGGDSIIVLGVLSDYVTAADFRDGSLGNLVVLGEVSMERLVFVSKWFEARSGGLLQILGSHKPSFLPGWVFEYPDCHYGTSNVSANDIDVALASSLLAGADHKEIPMSLLALCDGDYAEPMALTDSESEVLRSIREVRNDLGLSRLTATLILLTAFVRSIHDPSGSPFEEKLLRRAIFFQRRIGERNLERPFGKLDTEKFVAEMLSALGRARQQAAKQLESFRKYKLVGLNVLRGSVDGEQWTTIVAYCGGFMAEPVKARCGKSPLIIDEFNVCRHCRYLICDKCFTCSDKCQRNRLHHVLPISSRAGMIEDFDPF